MGAGLRRVQDEHEVGPGGQVGLDVLAQFLGEGLGVSVGHQGLFSEAFEKVSPDPITGSAHAFGSA